MATRFSAAHFSR